MIDYNCSVSDKNGKILRFPRSGLSIETLQSDLHDEGYFPISINVKTGKNIINIVRNSKKTIIDFTALLSILLESGLGVKDGLDILITISSDTKVKAIALKIANDLKAGSSFFSSICKLGRYFPDLYASMISVGERTGDLASIFVRLNEYLVRQKSIKEKLASSLIYPLIVLLVAVFSMIIISTFIVPKMTEMFMELGSEIPSEISRILLLSRGLFIVLLMIVPFILLILIVSCLIKRKSKTFAIWIDKVKLNVPFIGKYSGGINFLNILFTLDALISCGITVEDSIKEVTNTAGNKAIKEAFKRVHEKLMKGIELSGAMAEENIIPVRISKWIAVGERTGSIGKVFNQLSIYYENEIDKKSSRFMSLIEPALIIFTGLIIFGIVMLIIIPLFSTFGSLLE